MNNRDFVYAVYTCQPDSAGLEQNCRITLNSIEKTVLAHGYS